MNPSFEDTSATDYTVHYQICKNWFNPNASTADYFSPYCHIQQQWGNGYCSPQTAFGFQQAQDGSAYIGLIIWEPNNHTTKEYARGILNQSMVQGEKYDVSMYINMADSSNYRSCEIEIAFTDTIINSNILGSFNFTDTVKYDIYTVDTSQWQLLTGTYTAHGGEQYIYIGSNIPNSNITCIDTLTTGFFSTQGAYYFIDNIFVSAVPVSINEINSTQISIFPNPVSDVLYVKNLNKLNIYFIMDIMGEIVKSGQLLNQVDVSDIKNGIYFMLLNDKEYKIIINH
ncbi:MAG: T9SS type A sorting domain-containing protein [Bacteroidia bacterium]